MSKHRARPSSNVAALSARRARGDAVITSNRPLDRPASTGRRATPHAGTIGNLTASSRSSRAGTLRRSS